MISNRLWVIDRELKAIDKSNTDAYKLVVNTLEYMPLTKEFHHYRGVLETLKDILE